jgi:hypothetical protein
MHTQHGRHVRDELALRGRGVQLAGAAEPPAGVTGTVRKDENEILMDMESERKARGISEKGFTTGC